jgi:hypothetical protein
VEPVQQQGRNCFLRNGSKYTEADAKSQIGPPQSDGTMRHTHCTTTATIPVPSLPSYNDQRVIFMQVKVLQPFLYHHFLIYDQRAICMQVKVEHVGTIAGERHLLPQVILWVITGAPLLSSKK